MGAGLACGGAQDEGRAPDDPMHALSPGLLPVGEFDIPKALLSACVRPGYLYTGWLSVVAFALVRLSQRVIVAVIASVMAVVVLGIRVAGVQASGVAAAMSPQMLFTLSAVSPAVFHTGLVGRMIDRLQLPGQVVIHKICNWILRAGHLQEATVVNVEVAAGGERGRVGVLGHLAGDLLLVALLPALTMGASHVAACWLTMIWMRVAAGGEFLMMSSSSFVVQPPLVLPIAHLLPSHLFLRLLVV